MEENEQFCQFLSGLLKEQCVPVFFALVLWSYSRFLQPPHDPPTFSCALHFLTASRSGRT